jgi:hypothetical protein
MDKPIVYKKVKNSIVRTTNNLSSAEQTQATDIIDKFFTYFKAKHL